MRYPMNALVPTCCLSFRDAPSVATPAGEATRWDASQAGAAASLAGAMRQGIPCWFNWVGVKVPRRRTKTFVPLGLVKRQKGRRNDQISFMATESDHALDMAIQGPIFNRYG